MLPQWRPTIRISSIKLLLLLTAFALLGGVFLYLVGIDAINEKNPFQFFSDSNTYHRTYAGEAKNFDGTLISVSGNYLGPLLILNLLGGDPYLVMLLNVSIYFASLLRITTLLKLEPLKVGLLLLLSPMTISSLLSVNKEIFIFPFIAFALTGYIRRSFTAIVLAMLFSIVARWQLTAFYLVMLMISATPVRIFKRRGTVLIVTLLAASALYLVMQRLLEPVIAAVELSIENYDEGGSGLFEVFLGYQKQGLYFLIFPLKALHLLFASAIRLRQIDESNIYNHLFVAAHCAVTLLVFAGLLWRRALRLRSDLIFATAVFLTVFCLSPIYAPRYLYAVFVIWMLVLAGAPQEIREPRRSARRRPATTPPSLPELSQPAGNLPAPRTQT